MVLMSEIAPLQVLRKLSIENILTFHRRLPREGENIRFLTYIGVNHINYEALEIGNGEGGLAPLRLECERRGLLPMPLLDYIKNPAKISALRMLNYYVKTPPLRFIPSDPFLAVMQQIKIDVPVSSIPSGCFYYFEIDGKVISKDLDGMPISFILIRHDINKNLLTIGFYGPNAARHQLNILTLGETDTLEEAYDKYKDQSRVVENGEIIQCGAIDFNENYPLRMAINLILYVSNQNEDFIQQYNQFSDKKKIAQLERHQYTSEPYIVIGDDIKFLRLCTVDKTVVKGHWRNQPHGEGRLNRRWIFIGAHDRHYKTIHGEITPQPVSLAQELG
jgi:hypothetical protein